MTATATTAATSPFSALNATAAGQGGTSAATPNAAEQNDKFLKLLVTQMQNQDPLNPMDNAQLTTQIAQISTVSGIEQLNTSIGAMSTVMLQSQALQGASLVGKNVQIAGNGLVPDASGKASAGFDLSGPADSVVVTVTDASGKTVDTVDLGAQNAGRHSFDWQAPSGVSGDLTFAVSAKSGAQAVAATTLMSDQVSAVYFDGGQLNIETRNHGIVKYSDVMAVS